MVLLASILLRLADVGLVAELGHAASPPALSQGEGAEELLGLVGVGFLDGEVTDLAEQERTELGESRAKRPLPPPSPKEREPSRDGRRR